MRNLEDTNRNRSGSINLSRVYNSMKASTNFRYNPATSRKTQNKSHIYDIRFRRKDLKEFNPRDYRTAQFSEEDIIELKQVFDNYDSTGMGVLLPNDLKLLMSEHGFAPAKKTIYEIIAQFDADQTGGISFQEFMKAMSTKPIQNQSRRDVQKVFKKYDRENKGYFTVTQLKNVLREFKQPIDEQFVKRMIEMGDIDKDGKISFNDFYQVMTRNFY